MLTLWGVENEIRFIRFIRFQKTPNPGRLYGKVDTKLTFKEFLEIRLTE